MNTYPSTESWKVTKPAVEGTGGVVTSQHYLASRVGADVLRGGGNAVDAAVAASFAISTVEPWMSGLGGGGYMLVYCRASDEVKAISFGMKSPAATDAADYPVVEGNDSDLFSWPRVVEDRNVKGPHSIAIPGQVAGMAAALEQFGSRSWAQSIEPAIGLAQNGIAVDWYATAQDRGQCSGSRRLRGEQAHLSSEWTPAGCRLGESVTENSSRKFGADVGASLTRGTRRLLCRTNRPFACS